MYKTARLQPLKLILCLAVSVGTGLLSAAVTGNSQEVYGALEKPPLAPPPEAFPIVWTVLFILMGISSYIICVSNSKDASGALAIYGLQLAVNFIWPIIFFIMQAYLPAFIWLCLLWVLIVVMITSFKKISPLAAWLQVPYLLWVTFAGYLNFSIWYLNR